MKKVLLVIVVLIVLAAGTVIIVPLSLKNQIGQALLKKANDSVNATVNYDTYHLSLLKSFPDFTATFKDVSITYPFA